MMRVNSDGLASGAQKARAVRRGGTAAAVAAVLSVVIAPSARAAADEMTERMNDLARQLEKLQRELEELRAQQAQQAREAPQAQQAQPAQQPPAPAPAVSETKPLGGDSPAFSAGPLTVTFGGYTELAAIYRNRNETADVGSNFNTAIPFPNSSNAHVSEFRESARQSRLSILTQGPRDENSAVEAYFEMDFLGAAPTANSSESNSYNLRARTIYATYARKDWGTYLLAGQAWSLVTLEKSGLRARSENIPLTIDAQYVPGFNWTRNPQVRLVKEFNKVWSVGLSLESPQASIFSGPNAPLQRTVTTNPGGSLFSPTVNYSLDFAPDVVAKVAVDPGYGHYELYGLARWFRDRAGNDNDTVTGGGGGGGLILPLFKQLDFQASFLIGRGIGRYGSAQLPDVTVRPDGTLATVLEHDVLVGLNYRPISDLSFYGYVGTEHADARSFTAVVNGVTLGYGYGSGLYDNSECFIEGSNACAANTRSISQVTVGGWWKYYQGTLGNLQFGVQGSYTRRRTFEGVGGDPNAYLTVGMLAFRYYPYQK